MSGFMKMVLNNLCLNQAFFPTRDKDDNIKIKSKVSFFPSTHLVEERIKTSTWKVEVLLSISHL